MSLEKTDIEKISGLGSFSFEEKMDKQDHKETIYYPEKSDSSEVGSSETKSSEANFPETNSSEVDSSNEPKKAFLVVHPNTIELRTDRKLGNLLREKYESVMESRYFGRNGIEIVNSGQLSEDELKDLIRLSYNLTIDNSKNA